MRGTEHKIYGVFGMLALLAAPLSCWGASPWGKGGISAALQACEAELQACLEEPCSVFPGDGVTGAPLAYGEPDPPDGTFTDLNTGLIWEIKDSDDGIEDYNNLHDADNRYSWTTSMTPNVFQFVDELNDTQFAGYDDWRLPTVKELQSLVDYSKSAPAVPDSLPGAIGYGGNYWSSTPDADLGVNPWKVDFWHGIVHPEPDPNELHVRAVRGP